MNRLDAYEGCRPRDPRPHAYRRGKTVVYRVHRALTAWVYFYDLPTRGLVHIASGDFAAWRRQAAPGPAPAAD